MNPNLYIPLIAVAIILLLILLTGIRFIPNNRIGSRCKATLSPCTVKLVISPMFCAVGCTI